ncbi:integral membrane protein [Rutstroemia sp. NJR-2017a BBW]|nr:integral membrane protein [Rutstroemia sp. NJR-2017a BBW]
MKLLSVAATVVAYIKFASALATYSPGPTYSVGIPPATAAAGAGNIYLQLSAPDTYQWVGLGIGSRMAGATIFVMYSDGKGNVTVSGRDGGQGHVEPSLDTKWDVRLLEGSGVVGGVMRGNVLCMLGTNCPLLSTTSTSSQWIAAWAEGKAIDSTEGDYSINQHNDNSYRQFTYDLTQARIESDSNPFISTAATSSSGSASASQPTSVGAVENQNSGSTIHAYDIAHGTIMGLVMVVVFPLGALSMVVWGKAWVHGFVQLAGLGLLVVGFGLGVKLAEIKDYVRSLSLSIPSLPSLPFPFPFPLHISN